MTDYQALLDETVALVQAERGFVVLCDRETCRAQTFVASHNFDPELLLSHDFKYIQYWHIEKAVPRILKAAESVLTTPYDKRYFDVPRYRMIIPDRSLISILAIILRQEIGLLWCDTQFKNRVFMPQDLQQVIALVETQIQG